MSPASRAVKRLREMYCAVVSHTRELNSRLFDHPRTDRSSRPAGQVEHLEPRILLDSASLLPLSYAMPNGNTGTYHYWDELYDGQGNAGRDAAALSGGLGQLTDGDTGVNAFTADLGNGPAFEWVGWVNKNPQVTFDLGSICHFDSIGFHVNNQRVGGVSIFASVSLSFSQDGQNFGSSVVYTTTAADRADTTARFLDVPTDAYGRFVQATFTRWDSWVFLSKARFSGSEVLGISVDGQTAPASVIHTNNSQPTVEAGFALDVGETGVLEIDVDQDGTSEETMAVCGAGTAGATLSTALPDGQYQAEVTLVLDGSGETLVAVQAYVVDTVAPSPIVNFFQTELPPQLSPDCPPRPLHSIMVGFSEPLVQRQF